MMSRTKKYCAFAASALLACMLTTGVGVLGANAQAGGETKSVPSETEAWEFVPASWSFTEAGAVATGTAFQSDYLVRSDENAVGDYTVSATFRGTISSPNGKEVNIGIIPWYRDAKNYVITYLQFRDGVNLNDFQTLCFLDGRQYGTEAGGVNSWNDHWFDANGCLDTVGTLDPANEMTLKMEKRFDAASGRDNYTLTLSGTNSQETYVTKTFNADAYSISAPYAAEVAKVGLYSCHDTVTFSDFTVTPAEGSANYRSVAGSDASARTPNAMGWTYADGNYTVDGSTGSTVADTQAIVPNPNAEKNYSVSYTAECAGESGNVLSILPYYADENNFARFVLTQKEGGADVAIEGKVAGTAFNQSFEAYTGTIDWKNVALTASKIGKDVFLYLGDVRLATYTTEFTGGVRVGFGAKGNITFKDVETKAEEYVPYDWYTKDNYTISDRDMRSVLIDGNTITMAVDQAATQATRFYTPAGNFYNRIAVSGKFTVTENVAGAIYGIYQYYVDDNNFVRVDVTAEKIALTATQNGEATTYESTFAQAIDLATEHTLAIQAEFDAITVTFDGTEVEFESAADGVRIPMLETLESANVGAFAKGGSVTITEYGVSGFSPYNGQEENGWSIYGARLNTWTVSEDGKTLSNNLDGGTNFMSTNALRASELADPAKGYFIGMTVQASVLSGGEWKYGVVPYYKDNDNNLYVWLSQWADGATNICIHARANGAPVFGGTGFLETQVNFTMTEINYLEIEVTEDGSVNIYLNKSRTPTATTQIEAFAAMGAGLYGVNSFNVAATFADIAISAERIYSVKNEVIINIPSNFPTTGTVGEAVNLGVITASLEGDGGIAPAPVITVIGPDNESVELSGVRFTPTKAGTYTVTITATDSWGNSATETKIIVVSEADSGNTPGGNTDEGNVPDGSDKDEATPDGKSFPGWAIAVIVIGAVVVLAGAGTAIFFTIKKKKS